jgi:hypothetical protein
MTSGSKYFGKAGDKNSSMMVRRTVAAAIVGGTVSEIGGGKTQKRGQTQNIE